MNRRSKRPSSARRTIRSRNRDGSWESTSSTFRMRGSGIPWNIQQTTSGTGGFSANESKGSASASNQVVLDPFQIGGRLYQFASLFDQYRLNSVRIRYEPFIGPTGSIQTPTGAQNSGGLFERCCTMSYFADPNSAPSDFKGDIGAGGVMFRTCERKTLVEKSLQGSPWLYTSTTGSSPTAIDLRQSSFGALSFHYSDTSSTNSVTYGCIVVHWDVTFRSPLPYSNPLGFARVERPPISSQSTQPPQPEESKQVIPMGQPVQTAGWFYAK